MPRGIWKAFMKITRAEKCIIAFTMLFVVFTVGVHLGTRTSRQSVIVSSEALASSARENEGQNSESANADDESEEEKADREKADDAALTEKININTAGAEELQRLNGIGEKLSERIIDYREKNGSFEKTEDIMNVSGIGSGIYAKICADITVK